MARLSFNSFDSGYAMSSVRAIINDNFVNAMAKPFDGTSFIDTNSNTIRLVGINSSGYTFALSSANVISLMGDPLTVNNLTVTHNTNLGTCATSGDTVTINANVIGLNCNANFSGGTITATRFSGGYFTGSSVSATSGYFDNLYVNINGSYQSYQPFFTSSAFAENFDPYRLWIDTSTTVPTIKYCTSAAEASDSTKWVALGAVFG